MQLPVEPHYARLMHAVSAIHVAACSFCIRVQVKTPAGRRDARGPLCVRCQNPCKHGKEDSWETLLCGREQCPSHAHIACVDAFAGMAEAQVLDAADWWCMLPKCEEARKVTTLHIPSSSYTPHTKRERERERARDRERE